MLHLLLNTAIKKAIPASHAGMAPHPSVNQYWPKQTISRVLFPLPVSRQRAMTIHLGPPLPTASSNQPGSTDGPSLTLPYLVLLLAGFTWHPTSPPDPVSSYLTLSPLPV